MTQYLNVAERILRVAEEHPDRAAFVLPEGTISYAVLRGLILAYVQHAKNHGVGRGSIVAIDIDNTAMQSVFALACALIGAAWVGATPVVIGQRKLAYTHLAFGAGKKHVPSPTQLRVDSTWSIAPLGAPAAFDCAGPNDIWSYSQSSGTTGEPKFMAVAHRLNEEGFARGFGLPEGQRPVAAFLAPPAGAASITYIVRILAHGGTLVPGGDLDLMVRLGVNRVSGSPVQFAKLLDGAKNPVRKIYVGQMTGAAAPESLVARMLDFFECLQIWYGTTEMGIVSECTFDPLPFDPTNVGEILPTAEVELVDDEDRPVPAGKEGMVRIRRADREGAGYINADEAAKAIFRDGWFYPGDIGRFSERGELHIVGRSDDRLNVGGVKVDAGRVDAIVQNVPGVRDGYCFEDRDPNGASHLSLLLSLDDGTNIAAAVQTIYSALNDAGLYYRLRRAYVTDEVPRTMTGKPVRRLAAEFVAKQRPFTINLHDPQNH